jgi:hypothetical protein
VSKKSSKDESLVQQHKIKAALKQVLNQRGHTYKDVAKVWDCSEPTVKRQLGNEELPLSRLLTLLEWLSLSLADLHKIAESGKAGAPKWTQKQNEFLARHPKHFAFLTKLYSGESPKQIGTKYQIPPPEIEGILIQLEKYDLIRGNGRGVIRPAHKEIPSLDGELGQMHMRKVIDRLAQYYKQRIAAAHAAGKPGAGGRIAAAATEMSLKTFNEYRARLEKFWEDLTAAAKVDLNVLPKSELKTCVFMTADTLDAEKSSDLALVEDMFAEDLTPQKKTGSSLNFRLPHNN